MVVAFVLICFFATTCFAGDQQRPYNQYNLFDAVSNLQETSYWTTIGVSYFSRDAFEKILEQNKNNDYIIVEFKNGCGISEKMLPLIYNFAQTKNLHVYAFNSAGYRPFLTDYYIEHSETPKRVSANGSTTTTIELVSVTVHDGKTGKTIGRDPIKTEKDFFGFVERVLPGRVQTTTLNINSNQMVVGNKTVQLEVPAKIINGRTMVPMRAIFEALGATVQWEPATKSITSVRGSRTVKMQIGQKKMTVKDNNLRYHDAFDESRTYVLGEKAVTLDTMPQIVNSKTLVPARAVAEALGYYVEWDAAHQRVIIK